MDTREFLIKRIEIAIALVSLTLVFVGAYQAFSSYKQNAALQAMRALHEAQLNACKAISLAGAKFLSAKNPEQFFEAFLAFSETKHSVSLLLLDKPVLESAVELHNVAVPLLKAKPDSSFRETVRCTLGNRPFKLSLACRRVISDAYSRESGSALSPLADEFVMGWTGDCKT